MALITYLQAPTDIKSSLEADDDKNYSSAFPMSQIDKRSVKNVHQRFLPSKSLLGEECKEPDSLEQDTTGEEAGERKTGACV